MSLREVSFLVLVMVGGCVSEVTQAQRDRAEALVATHDKAVADAQQRLVDAASGQLGPEGPLMPRADLGPCPEVATAAHELAAEPLPPLTAETEPEAEAELAELARRAANPTITTSHLLVADYEMVITPEVDPELKGFKPGVGRGWLALVDVATGQIVCAGTSSVQVTTADVQIHRRPVPASLTEPERIAQMKENLQMVQRQIEADFRSQLLERARENLVRSGPYDAELAEERPIDTEEARRLLGN